MPDPYTVLLPETQINTTESGSQESSGTNAFVTGGWLSTFQNRALGSFDYDVVFRTYADDGSPTSDEIFLAAPDRHSLDDVATLPDGGWIILWRITDFANSQLGIGVQRFDANGISQGDPVLANTHTTGSFSEGQVSTFEDGGWIVSWTSNVQASTGTHAIYFQRFATDGSMVGEETRISDLSVRESNADIEVLEDGGFVALWTVSDSLQGNQLYMKRFGADGVALTGDIQVNTTIAENFNNPQVAHLEDGGWIVTWSPLFSFDGDGSRPVFYQRFDSDGQFVSAETQVNPPGLAFASNATVTGLQSGGWIIAWNESDDFGGQLDSHSQRYAADGTPIGDALLINTHLPGYQSSPIVEELINGNIVMSWTSDSQDISSNAAFQTLLELSFEGETFVGTGIDDDIMGMAGDDTLEGAAGDDTINGGAGDDIIDGGEDHDIAVFSGDVTNFSIEFASMSNSILITDVVGSEGADTLSGIESIEFDDRTLSVQTGTDNNDTLVGDALDNMLLGGEGADYLLDLSGGDDVFIGGAGNDQLQGSGGSDAYFGGADTDEVRYNNSDAAVVVNLAAGTATGGHALGDSFDSIENLVGSQFGDTLTGDDVANRLDGFAGDDRLIGGLGADVLFGGSGEDTADYSDSAVGVDVGHFRIGTGGTAQGDQLIQVEGIVGSNFADTLVGSGFYSLAVLSGGDGDDLLFDYGGASYLSGGAGDDTMIGRLGADEFDGGADIDVVRYADAIGAVIANLATGMGTGADAEGDTYVGVENLVGSIFFDTLVGDDGANNLRGGAGRDTISGGGGNDQLYGDADLDTFVFDALDWGDDLIFDFDANPGREKLDFSATSLEFSDFSIVDTAFGLRIDYADATATDGFSSIALANVEVSAITADDFIFAV